MKKKNFIFALRESNDLVLCFKRSLVLVLTILLAFSPRMIQLALAQDDSDQAAQEEVDIIQTLAQHGYLGDKKNFYTTAKELTEDDITDGLLMINSSLSQVDLKSITPGSSTYQLGDLKQLLKLVQDKSDDIRDRKVSAWKFENRIKKIIQLLSPSTPVVTGTPQPTATFTPLPPTPTPTNTPIPGPSREEFNQLKVDLKDLLKITTDMQGQYDKKFSDMVSDQGALKTSNTEIQDQLKLVKNLLDRVQEDLKTSNDRLEVVAQKADQKTLTDEELQQELTILHKDLRDNSQDVSILKEEYAKLEMASNDKGASPLDQFLSSKWLGGGALLVGLTALIVAVTRK